MVSSSWRTLSPPSPRPGPQFPPRPAQGPEDPCGWAGVGPARPPPPAWQAVGVLGSKQRVPAPEEETGRGRKLRARESEQPGLPRKGLHPPHLERPGPRLGLWPEGPTAAGVQPTLAASRGAAVVRRRPGSRGPGPVGAQGRSPQPWRPSSPRRPGRPRVPSAPSSLAGDGRRNRAVGGFPVTQLISRTRVHAQV